MNQADFEHFIGFLKTKAGIVITAEKAYLVENRLAPVARKHGIASANDVLSKLRHAPPPALINDVLDAMTTNETLFFRDQRPFDQFRDKVIPELLERNAASKRIRIWCAACSSGQEPYSLAMLFNELGTKVAGWRLEIVATDISKTILDRARKAEYSQFEVQRGLPITMLVKYFEQKGEAWALKQDIKSKVQFREFNLLESPRALGQFDVVFCRNVLIYFDHPTKADILSRIAGVMPSNGYLFLGGAETVLGVSDKFAAAPGLRGIYLPNDKSAARAA
ncbi:MAG: protein-glutamate O-methyltransferase CheR [Alphaproteobacteria bacterium]|nr:protein-glutamate O-methyltransferase CheR [Alphaproteobacteria bacterium]